MSKKYAVVIERADGNYSAYVPDLPGCVAVGDTVDQCATSIQEAIEAHIQAMRAEGMEVPQPSSFAREVEIQSIGS